MERKRISIKKAKKLGVKVPAESMDLLEYIRSLGVRRSNFNILRSSESSLKIVPPTIYELPK